MNYFYWFAVAFLALTAAMVLFAVFLGFLEARNPSPPTSGTGTKTDTKTDTKSPAA